MLDIKEVERLTLKPGDVLVVKVPSRLSPEARAGLRESLRALFPEHKCAILEEGMTLEVVNGG